MGRKRDGTENAASFGLAVLVFFGKLACWAMVALCLYVGVTRGYQFGYEVFHPTAVSSGAGIEKEVVIPEQAAAGTVTKILKENGLIQNRLVFRIQYVLFECKPKAGIYRLSTSMTAIEIIHHLNGQDSA
ncbi:MAG: aminodeoxychorismate lyase [bacterium]|nr:aminodeoxychorismate lyase [bacterium]